MDILLSILAMIALVLLASLIIMAAIPVLQNRGIRHPKCPSKKKLNGKTVLVTGTLTGIGKETAREFANRNARVIMACMDLPEAKKVAEEIIGTSGNKNVVVYELDLSSMKSVRKCAAEILKKEKRLDVLVNNAGIGGTVKKIVTADGFELTMAINHFGHFLFTNLLLGLIKKSSPARIITVASENHKLCKNLDTKDMNFKTADSFSQLAAYNQSKLCNILFTFELARILSGTGVTANCVFPGMTATAIFGNSNNLFLKVFGQVAKLTAKTPVDGAQTSVYAAVAEDATNLTGKYFGNCRVKESSKLSKDVELARKLWDASVKAVKLQPHEVHY